MVEYFKVAVSAHQLLCLAAVVGCMAQKPDELYSEVHRHACYAKAAKRVEAKLDEACKAFDRLSECRGYEELYLELEDAIEACDQ